MIVNAQVKPALLIVDDEQQVINAIEDQFATDFEVHVATDGSSALELVQSLPELSVLLSDQRMPGMNGDELLSRAATVSKASRVLLTGYADLEAVIRAVNRGQIFGYVTKPWDEENLRLTLQKASEHHRLVRELQQERDLLHNLMESVPDEIYFKGRDYRFVRLNKSAARSVGIRSPEEAIGQLDSNFFKNPRTIEIIHAEDRHIIETGECIEVDKLTLKPDGSSIWKSIMKSPVKDTDGKVNSIVSIARDITARKILEKTLEEREALLRKVLDSLPVGVWVTDKDGKFIMNNPEGETVWAGRREGGIEVYGEYKGWWADTGKRITPEEWALARAIQRGETSLGEVVDIECFDGTRKTIRNSAVPITDTDGAISGAVVVVEDITERRAQEKRIARLTRTHAMLSGINAMIVRVSSEEELFQEICRLAVHPGEFTMMSIRTLDESGMSLLPVALHGPGELAGGPLLIEESAAGVNDGSAMVKTFNQRRMQVCNNIKSKLQLDPWELSLVSSGITSVASFPLLDGDRCLGVITYAAREVEFFDEDEIRLLSELVGDVAFALKHIQQSRRIQHLTHYNPLSGLANRSLFEERLAILLTNAEKGNKRMALVVVDLERFRLINETLGRQGGDTLLKMIAEKVVNSGLLEVAEVSHIGADHFAIIINDVMDKEDLENRIHLRMEEITGAPYNIYGTEVRISARLGIALFPDDGAESEVLFNNAETALKRAKQLQERFLYYNVAMTQQTGDRLSLENKLRRAIEKKEFVLHYQPKVSLQASRMVGAEALIRWQDPESGLVPPGKFIPLLEETGLILEVGYRALRQAALEHRQWVDQGLDAPRVAVNVSAIQLRQRDFVDRVKEAISVGVKPTCIDIEITESLLMDDLGGNIEKLAALSELGIKIAIDDFGTGYSSLAYLARLPVHALKIDRSFIISMDKDPNAMTLVSTMISLAHSLGLSVVAEGVETDEQAKILRLLRCEELQGFLFSRPLEEHALIEMLRKQNDPQNVPN